MRRVEINRILRLHNKVSGGMGSSVKDQKKIAKELGLKLTDISTVIQIHEDNNYTRDSKLILKEFNKV